MDSDTRKLDPQTAARVDGNPAPTTPVPPVAPVPPAPAWTAAPPEPPAWTATPPAPPVAATNSPPPTNGAVPPPTVAPRPVAPALFGGNTSILPIALIVLGALLLFSPFDLGDIFGSAIVLIIGLGFLYAYSQSHNFGFLVPGSILTGLGAGIVVETMSTTSGWVPLGLGLGFCAIWFLHRAHWWALIPGGIIALAGLQDLVSSNGFLREVWPNWQFNSGNWWPLLLVLAGIWLIAARRNATPQP
jgi:hypothetical protein